MDYLKKIARQYHAFIRRSVETLPHDIVSPYHKVIDLMLKLTGISFACVGAYMLFSSAYCYAYPASELSLSILENIPRTPGVFSGEYSLSTFLLMRMIVGIGNILIAVFVSTVLIVRHLNETLPDHIYLRCFSSDEEKARRLRIK